MNSKNNEEMKDEYDLRPRRGVRGKYYDRYRQLMSINLVFVGPPFVASITSSAPSIGAITKTEPHPFRINSPLASVHAS